MFDDVSILDLTSLAIALTGLFLALMSLIFAFSVFIKTQKNYYRYFLKFLSKKEKKIKRNFARKKINDPIYAEYLMEDLRFFGENFFVNFSADGYLKYAQYKTIKIIYRHLRKRLLITARIFWKAAKKQKNSQIIARLQLFNKYNYINKTYYNNKLKDAKMTKNNPNVYITIRLKYDREKKVFVNESVKKPFSIFEMGSDFEFKKNMYYIFSRANKFEEVLDEEELDKQYFFVACTIIQTHKNVKLSDQQLEEIEKIKENEAKK